MRAARKAREKFSFLLKLAPFVMPTSFHTPAIRLVYQQVRLADSSQFGGVI